MGIFKKPSTAQAQQTAPINNILVNESVRGKLIPIALGTPILPMWLVWNDDFKTITNTTTQHVGGGLFGSGGGDTKSTTTTYQTAFQAGLAYGQINHVANVWNGSGKVQAIAFTENFTVPPGGGIFHPAPPGGGGFVGIRAVGFAQTYSQTLTDFGAPSSTVLSGSFVAPMLQGGTPSTGVYTVNPSTGATTFAAGDAGKSVQITYTANFTVITSQEEDVIPSGGTIQVPNSTQYAADGGVMLIDPTTFAQTPMLRVTGTLSTGQYTVNSTGLYGFATADHGKFVRITWQQSDPTATGAAATLNFSLINGVEGQAPWSYLTGAHPDAALGYSGIATVQSSALQLGSSAEMPQLSFEVVGSYLAGGSIVDCNPSDVLYAYLTDHLFGIDFPTANIEWNLTPNNFQTSPLYSLVPIIGNPGYNAQAFWAANNYFISPVIDNQTTVSQEFANILEAGQTAVIWSEGLLKLRPYGDTSAAGNGFVYQPLTQPVFDLGIDDFVAGAGEEAIKVTRSAWNGTYNVVQIQFSDRLNGYDNEIFQEEDLASIQAFGEQREDPQDYSAFIRAASTAQWVANMRVKRLSNIRNSYEFTISAVYDILEPMDLVTLTHPDYGFNKLPVRITKIEDDPEKGLTITAENFPYGIANATLYPKQTNLALNSSPALQEPGNAEPLILELPDQFSQFQGYTMRIYAVPDDSTNWGGCNVYLSGDNVEFDAQGSITTPALAGTLTASVLAGTGDPDTGSIIDIAVSNNLQLLPASSFDFANLAESCLLCIVDAAGTFEIVAYQNAVLTGVNTYSVSTFHRGLYGTTRASHASDSKVLKMDQGHLQLTYPKSQAGTTNWVKLTSFNTVGARMQDVNIVASNSFPLTGAFPGFFDKTTGQLWHSTPLNNQGSIPPNQGVLINYTFPSTSTLITTWGTQSLLRSDSSSLTVNASGGANIVVNGDGESGTVGSAAPNFTLFGGASLLTANDFVHSGTKSLKITHTGGNNSLSEQGVSLTGGVTYVVEGWIKTDALTNVSGHGVFLNCATGGTVSSYTIITKFGAADSGQTTFPTIGVAANGSAQPFTFVQCYFIPATSGTMNVSPQMISANAGSAWFDDVKVYPYFGAIYTGLTASTTYYLYPYVEVASGNMKFANGNPPTTSPSDTFAMTAQLDGRVPMAVIKPTSPASTPPPGGGFGGTGGGSGTCPEFNELVYVQRYSHGGRLIFDGQIKAGEVQHGYESDDGKIKRGDFLKGFSFKKNADVYRAVQKVMAVPCRGWSIVNGHRVTACEHVFVNGQWMPAWKAPGATHDSCIGRKVLIQVEADWDDEHNYYVGDLLIHNAIILGC